MSDAPAVASTADGENPPKDDIAASESQAPGSTPPPDSPRRRRRIRFVLIALAVVVVVTAVAWLLHYQMVGKYFEETDNAYLHADSVTISPKVSGYITKVLVADNATVKAGQPLAIIDSRDYIAQTERYRAQIEVALANADAVRAQIDEQEASIMQAHAQLNTAQASADYAQREAERYSSLVAVGAEKAETLASRRNDARQSLSKVAAQRAALQNAERKIASLKAQVRQAEAEARSAKAQLNSAEVDLEATTIVASIDGRVGDRTVRMGQFVQSGTRLMNIVPTHNLYATANFKETQVGRMRVGQPVELTVDALPGIKLHGTVDSLSPGTGSEFSLLPPQNATGNFTKIVQRVPVRIALNVSTEALEVMAPGMSLTVEVDTTTQKDALERIESSERNQAGNEQ